MKNKTVKAICAALALTVMLSGCSFIGGKNTLNISGTVLAGQVSSIKDKTVTLTLGYITEPSGKTTGTDADAGTSAEPEASPETSPEAQASPSPSEETAAAPTVDEGTQESPAPTDTETAGETASADAEDDAAQQSGVKGVQANVATFTLGNSVATLEIGDTAMLYKEDGTSAAISDIKEGSILAMSLDAKGTLTKITIRSIPRIIISEGVNYIAANEYSTDTQISSESLSSSAADENAAIVDNGAECGFDTVTIDRTSAESAGGSAASDYGVGAALLTTNGKTFVRGSKITTDANGGNGIFSYGSGRIYAASTSVSTKQQDSNGLRTAGGGKLYVWDMTVDTQGDGSAALSGEGEGKLVVNGGSYTTAGSGAPAVLSEGSMAVNGATLTASASEAACVDGANTLYVFDSSLSSSAKEDGACAVLVYSSDASSQEGEGTFKMVGGSLQGTAGSLIFVTNTRANILLSGVDASAAADGCLLRCTGTTGSGAYGEAGKNGAQCSFTGSGQTLEGNVIWDSISTLDFYLQDASKLTGAVRDDESAAGGKKGDGGCDMYISKDSTWVVTGDSELTNLYCAGKIVDADGNTVTIKSSSGKRFVRGTSEYSVTVEDYSTSADFSGSLTVPSWSDYQVTKPSGM
jgi:hypothetical protein